LEDFSNSYKNDPVVTLGIEIWNANKTQASSFAQTGGISFPYLINGGSTAQAYGAITDYLYILDENGIIIYKKIYGSPYNPTTMSAIIDSLLANMGATLLFPTKQPKLNIPGLIISPNPSRGKVMIQFSNLKENATVNIYNTKGQKIQNLFIPKDRKSIVWTIHEKSPKMIPQGMYLIEADFGNNKKVTKRLFVQR